MFNISSCLVLLQVSQGNVPGVESASLAMDTEEGVEVVWNEVLFSDKKVFKAQEVLAFLQLLQSIKRSCSFYLVSKVNWWWCPGII